MDTLVHLFLNFFDLLLYNAFVVRYLELYLIKNKVSNTNLITLIYDSYKFPIQFFNFFYKK